MSFWFFTTVVLAIAFLVVLFKWYSTREKLIDTTGWYQALLHERDFCVRELNVSRARAERLAAHAVRQAAYRGEMVG